MFLDANQLLCHFAGDYLLQSGWMADGKVKSWLIAFVHAAVYCLPFLFLKPSSAALAFMFLTHATIDRWRLASFLCFAGEFLAPKSQWPCWSECNPDNGLPRQRPPWLASILFTIHDNALHIICNALALKYL